MKSRAEKALLASTDVENPANPESVDQTPAALAEPPKPARPASGFDATMMVLIGISAVAGGMLLCLGPKLSWKFSQIADGFKHLGVQGGVLVMGGLIMVAIGLLRRGQLALRTPTTEQAEDRLLLEQLTKDSLRSSETLDRLERGMAHFEATTAGSCRELEERIASASREGQDAIRAIPVPPEVASPEEAIFRLAASLDQVGMRIEQRLKTQYTALQDHLEDVGAAILSARNHMQGLQQGGEHHVAVLREEVKSQVDTALEETGFWNGNRRAKKLPSLGLLDSIEDSPVSPLPDVASIASALPLNPEEAREHGAAIQRRATPEEVDTKTRLIQLSSLLADPKLRKALEGISSSNA